MTGRALRSMTGSGFELYSSPLRERGIFTAGGLTMYITTVWLFAEALQVLLIDFFGLPPRKQFALLVIFVTVTVIGYKADHADIQDRTEMHSELADTKQLLNRVVANQALEAKPGLRKNALELGETLMSRGSHILLLEYPEQRLEPNNASAWKEANTETQRLMFDYRTTYASQVRDLREQFLAQGLTWNNEQYYLNPANPDEVANVGMDLVRHANQLK